MKLTQLQYFQTICKYNNITRASAELHVSQPSLSNAIKELEEEFGISLFYRLSKGLCLTEEGEILLEEATRLLEQADRLVSRMNAISREKQHVKLGIPPMLASLIFPDLLHSYRIHFPGSKLQTIEHGTLINRAHVLDGTLDAAIISCDGELPASFHYCDLVSLKIYFYTSIDNPIAARSSVSVTEASAMPLAMLAEDSFLTNYLLQYYRSLNITPDVIIHTNQITMIRQLIENNTASAFLFQDILETDKNIVRLSVEDLPAIKIRLVWNANRRLSAGVQNLIRMARMNYPKTEKPAKS